MSQPSNIVFAKGSDTEFRVIDWAGVSLIKYRGLNRATTSVLACQTADYFGTLPFTPKSSMKMGSVFETSSMNDW